MTNNEAVTLYRWIGYDKEFFLTSLQAGLDDPTTIDEKLERFKVKPDLSTAEALAVFYDSQEDYSKAIKYYNDAASLSNFVKDYAYEIFTAYYYGLRNDQFSIKELKKSANVALKSKLVNDEERAWLYYYMSNMITKKKDDPELINFIQSGQNFFIEQNDDNFKRQKKSINILYALYIDKNPEKAIRLKKASLSEGWDEDARGLNDFCWWCFEHEINLDEAEKLIREGVELAEPGGEKAMILDTAAEIVNLKGNPKEAVELTKLAIKESPKRNFYQRQLERFKKLIK